ncbi:MAG: MoxR family ATPase [Nitriliruptorales bacterium]|nr:MoxR family ATPase [Nitriliruptorales bacterium]
MTDPADRGLLPNGVDDPDDLRSLLAEHAYLADTGLGTAVFLALKLGRPLFLEGEPGVGKTEVGRTLAAVLDAPLIRLQCYEGIDATQALYDWDFPRQLLHLRAAEAAHAASDVTALEDQLYDRRFLIARPLLAALETTPSVLLIDEIDRADDEFEAFLLEVLSDFAVTVPELGTIRAETRPVVVVTSNRTREVHDALKRRCYYHWLDHPTYEREVEIVCVRVPEVNRRLAEQVAKATQALRQADLFKPPGVAESIDWTEALVALGVDDLDPDTALRTIGAVLKYREDQERMGRLDVGEIIAASLGA